MTPIDAERLHALGMLASAFAGRAVAVDAQRPGDPPWTDGQTIFVDPSLPARTHLAAVAVQASMIAAGSLDPDIVRPLARHSRLAKRYLAIEGHRALVANADILPRALASLGNAEIARRSNSPAESLSLASGNAAVDDPPPEFGVVRAGKLLATSARAATRAEQEQPAHIPRGRQRQELAELDDGEVDETDGPDLFTSPVGGGGFIGKWLKKMLSSTRKTGSGGGPPGADNPTHRISAGKRGAHAVSSLASAATEDVIDHASDLSASGVTYPEWDVNRRSYRADWCTVFEIDSAAQASASPAIDDAIGLRRPLARLGMGLHRRHRQVQGDDIDIDAAVEAHVEAIAGSVPDEAAIWRCMLAWLKYVLLSGTSVTIGSQSAFVDYISPLQVNVQVPGNVATGSQSLVVTTAAGSGAAFTVTLNPTMPGLLAPTNFKINGTQYVVAQFADGTYVLPTGAIAGLNSRPAKPGDTSVIYGIGIWPGESGFATGPTGPRPEHTHRYIQCVVRRNAHD